MKLPNTIQKDKLILWYNTASSFYALGIAGSTLQYTSDGNHIFYTNATETMKLDSSGNLSTSAYIYAGGTTTGIRINGNDYGNTFYQHAETIGTDPANPANIGFTLRGTNSFNFNSLSTTGGGYTNILSMNTSGISLFGNLIYNYLFNSSGFNHETINDFNSITNFGYRFIQGNINGPNSSYTQWYQWYIGLGINYNSSLYGAQFALPRNTNNPYLYIRYKEGSTWGLWNSIRVVNADIALGLAGGNQTISGNLSVTGNIDCNGTITPTMTSVDNIGTDYVGVQVNTSEGSNYKYPLCIMYGSFTAFHRCFLDNEPLFDINNSQDFKDNYLGRIVISSGKIATDTKKVDDEEWSIKYDKEGIMIEDSVFMIQLSRKKNDKRVVGVLGSSTRSNSREERMIVNGIGEGAVWVINSNGNFENGDLITTSDFLGFGQLQDDDLIHNYTCGKITMSCDFQLNSPLYECKEIDEINPETNEKLRVAFVACVYYCS